MKKNYLVVLFLLMSTAAFAQVGIGTESPNVHAVLELKSPTSNQGLIVPSLTTAQRTATTFTSQLGPMDNGLLIYDKDENKFYYWQATGWLVIVSGAITGGATGPAGGDLSGTFPNPQIAASVITTVELNNNAVTSAKIADGTIVTIDLADGSVTDAKVGLLTPAKLSAGGATSGQVLKWNGSNWTAQTDNTGGSGTVTSIATGTGLTGGPVTTTGTIGLSDNGVTTIKINNNAVTTAKILDATIVTADLADGLITDVKVTSVAPSKLTASGATAGQALKWSGTAWTPQADAGGAGTVTNVATGAGLTGGPVTATGTISLADNGVTTVKINDNAVTTAKILDATIVTADLADGSITDVKVASVAPSKLTASGATTGQALKWSGTAWTPQTDAGGSGTVTSVGTGAGLSGGPFTTTGTISLADNGVTTIKINNNAITTAKILDGEVATTDLSDGAVTDVKVTSVAPSKLTAAGATTGQVLKWNGANWVPQADNGGGAGTVTSIATGGGLTGGPVTTTGTISIADDGVTSIKIADGSISNADINAGAAIVDSKLATISTAGKVSGNAITSGTIGGSTAVNTAGSIATSSGVTSTTTGTTTSVNVTSASGHAVYAYSTAGGRGVWGYSPSGIGVEGQSNSNNGVLGVSATSVGVWGESTNYIGIYGRTNNGTASGYGVYGTAPGSFGEFLVHGYGVYGNNSFTGAYGYMGGQDGVYGFGGGYGYGVQGRSTSGIGGYFSSNTGYGMYATSNTTHAGYFNGSVWVTNGFTVAGGIPRANQSTFTIISDRRTKKDIVPFSEGLSTVLKINPVTFKYNGLGESENNGNEHIGVIAQDMLAIAPYMIQVEQRKLHVSDELKTEMFVFDASSLGYVLVNSIKEQQHLIEEQQRKIDTLQQTVDELMTLKQKFVELESFIKKYAVKEAHALADSRLKN